MNALLWLWHIAALAYAWPLLRDWWRGAVVLGRTVERKRWLVALSVGMPPIAAMWLLPVSIAHRHDLRRDAARRAAAEQRAADVAFWRQQVAQGDVFSAAVGVELLAMWGARVSDRPASSACEASPAEFPLRWLFAASDPQAGDAPDRQGRMQEARESILAGFGVPQAMPGAHEYSHGCDCRNCVKARRRASERLGGAPVRPPRGLPCRCGAASAAEACTVPTDACPRGWTWENEVLL